MTLSREMIDRMVIYLISENPHRIEVIKPKYLDDEVWRYAIDLDPTVFQYNKRPSESLCYYALKQDGNNMKWCMINAKHFITRNFCMKALKYNPEAIIYFPEKFITRKLLVKTAERKFSIVKNFPTEKFPRNFIAMKVIENPFNIQYVRDPWDDLIYQAVKKEPLCASYFPKLPEKVEKMLWDDFPNTAQCIENTRISNEVLDITIPIKEESEGYGDSN